MVQNMKPQEDKEGHNGLLKLYPLTDKKLEKQIRVDASPSIIGMSIGQLKDREAQYMEQHSNTSMPSQQVWPQCEKEFYGLSGGLEFAQDFLGDVKIICTANRCPISSVERACQEVCH